MSAIPKNYHGDCACPPALCDQDNKQMKSVPRKVRLKYSTDRTCCYWEFLECKTIIITTIVLELVSIFTVILPRNYSYTSNCHSQWCQIQIYNQNVINH